MRPTKKTKTTSSSSSRPPSPPPQTPLQLFPTHPFTPPPVPQPLPPQPPVAKPRRQPKPNFRSLPSPPIPPPFPWATDRRVTVHSWEHLVQNQINSISGLVQCKRCKQSYEMEFDLHEKFREVGNFISANKSSMCDRAPTKWMYPVLPSCRLCQQVNSVEPVMAKKKKNINWLFLLLGELLGCCTIKQLSYFCKHTNNHSTGAKDRVLYLTYLALRKQVDPNNTFDFEYRE